MIPKDFAFKLSLLTLLKYLGLLLRPLLVIETIFLFYYLHRKRSLNSSKASKTKTDPMAHFAYCCSVGSFKFLPGWFSNCSSLDDIHVLDLQKWIAWAFFDSLPSDLSPKELRILKRMVIRVQCDLKHTFLPGKNPNIEPITLAFNQINAVHRPFLLYLGVYLLDFVGYILYKCHGFEFRNISKHHSYYHKKGNDSKPPIVFYHGLGGGLWSYFIFIFKLIQALPDTSIILIESKHVSMKLIESPPHDLDFGISTITRILETNGFDKAHFVGIYSLI